MDQCAAIENGYSTRAEAHEITHLLREAVEGRGSLWPQRRLNDWVTGGEGGSGSSIQSNASMRRQLSRPVDATHLAGFVEHRLLLGFAGRHELFDLQIREDPRNCADARAKGADIEQALEDLQAV